MFYGIRSKSVEYTVIFDGLYNTKSECEYRTYLVKITNAQKVFLRFESRVSCTLQGRSIAFAILQKKRGGGRQTKKRLSYKVKLIKKGGGFLLCCYVPAKAVQMENVSKYWFANSETGIFVSR